MKIRSSFFIWAVLVTTAGLFTLAGLSLIDVPGDGYLAALWLALSCYVGGDQVAAALKTRSLPAGTRFTGNRKKVAWIVFSIFLLGIQAAFFKLRSGVDMPVTEVFAAFVTTAGLLAGGEKAKTALEGGEKK